jgi:adenylate cyclase
MLPGAVGEDAPVTDHAEPPATNEISVSDLERELLGGDRVYTREQVAERSGIELDHARELWRALGFADPEDDEPAFTDRDVWALQTVDELRDRGWLDQSAQVAMTRALGQSLGRLAEWQIAAIGSMVDPDASADAALGQARDLVPVVEGLMGYVWRRHLAAAAGRALASSPEEFADRTMVVGFADLVGFTSLTRDIDEAGLARLVERFESSASDIVAECGGRVVKTVGDEVMFVADRSAAGAEIGMRLSEQVGADDELPDLRVGLAHGSVVARLGDVYGEPVNIASRLTSIARPGSVLVDRGLNAALEDDGQWRLRRATPRPVRGYAMLHPYRLRRADSDVASSS